MATNAISGFSTVCSICRAKSQFPPSSLPSLSIRPRVFHPRGHGYIASNKQLQSTRKFKFFRSVAEDADTLIPEQAADDNNTEDNTQPPPEEASSSTTTTTTSEQPVSVPVSPSDILTMFFQAEGTMAETVIPAVTNALQDVEGITNLKVQVVEGIASAELTKQTTVQATGVASNLVEIIQGSGFKLQTLNLSFEDEDDIM